MKLTSTLRMGTAIAFASAALLSPGLASAQITDPMSADEIRALPNEYQSGPIVEDFEEVTVSPDGVETITRTRRIETRTAYPTEHGTYASTDHAVQSHHGYPHHSHVRPQPVSYGYAPGAAVFQRDQWIAECERRTARSDDREKGGIIGSLLGAITGGIIGNRVAGAGERLGGTLIGGGVGALGGLLLGQLIGGGRNDRGEYDCEAALDSYLSQYGQPGGHIAARSIPAPAYAPPVHYGYGYAPAYPSYGYSYSPPQQIVYVPIEYQQQQRVVVREVVREEIIPGGSRNVPTPRPVPRPAPPRYIKGN